MAPPAVHGSRTRTTRGHWGRRPGGICPQSVPEGELRGDCAAETPCSSGG